MKKLLALTLTVSMFVLAGCDFFVDKVAVHNGLVKEMDDVYLAEEAFYDEYWALLDGVDTTPFLESAEEFKKEAQELDDYFTNTTFHSTQQVFVDEYNSEYKSFIEGYLEDVDTFTARVESEGFSYEGFEDLFTVIDDRAVEFVNVHQSLAGTVNVQSDYTGEASY